MNNLTKEVRNFCSENYETPDKGINKEKFLLVQGLEVILLEHLYHLKQSVDSMQFLSECQGHSS